MLLGMEVSLGQGDIVLDWDPAPPNKGHSTPLLVHVCCGQTAGWIKMPLDTEIDLSPCHIALDGDPALPRMGHSMPPLLGPYLLWTCGQMVAHVSYC